MPYYHVNVENNHVGISLLGCAREAVIECKDEDFRNCKICHVDYRAVDDKIGTWGGDPKRWKIKDVFNNLPDSHVFNVGDKVRLKNLVDVHPAIKHVYDGLKLGKTYTINLIHYYSGWSNETYSIVGVESGYEGWIPQEFFELYVEKKVVDIDDEVDLDGVQPRLKGDSPFKPGEYPFYSSTETTTSIMYPQIPSEAYQTSQSKLKALKQQKPITLKTKKSWK